MSALFAGLILSAALTGDAATLTWTGGAGDGRISTAANWSPQQSPASGDVLILAGNNFLAPQLTTNLTVGSITFNSTAAAFTLGGTAAYTVSSGITNNSTATETIATAITLGASQSWNAANGALTISGPITNAGRRLTISGANSTTLGGVLSGTGGLTKTGAGTLTLSGANTFTGTSTLTTGTVVIGSNQALGTSVVTLNGATLQADATARSLANTFTLKANSTIGGSQNLTFSGLLTESGGSRTLTVNNTAAAIFSGGIRLSNNKTARTLTIAGSGNTVVNSVISNGASATTGNIIQTGTGTLTLGGSSSNTYIGTITVNGGTLLLAKTAGLAVTGDFIVGDGNGTDTARLLAAEQISDASAVTLNSSGVLDLNGFSETIGSFTGAGAVTLGGGTLTVGGGNASWTFAGSLTGAGGLVKNGSGTLTLTGTANSPGSLTANAGTIVIGAAGAISSSTVLGASGSGIVSLGAISATAGGLNLTAGTVQTTTGVLTLAGDVTATSSGGTAALVAGKLALSGTRTFTVNAGGATSDLTVSAVVSGSGGLVKTSGGVLLLSGANTYTGTTTVNAGTLRLSGGAAIADATAISLANASGAVLDLAGTSETVGSLAGGGISGGNVTLGSGTLTTGGSNASTIYSGTISGTGGLVKNGSGTFTLAGTNTFTGATAINAGILQLSGGSALSASTAVTLASVAGAALDLAGSNAAIGSLGGGGASGGNVTLGSGTVTIGANNTNTSFAGIISGSGGVTKAGTGALTLTGANTFTGALRGTGGTLTLSGAGTAIAAASIVLDSGSKLTLDNSGTNIGSRIGDAVPVSFNGGTLAFISGTSGSSETVGALQLAGGNSTIAITHNGTGSNATVLTFSSLGALGSGATVNFNATTGTLGAAATGPQVYITGLANGFIGGWATVGTNFAEYSTFGVRALTGYYTGVDGINVNDPAQLPLLASTSPITAYTLTRLGTTTDKGLNLTDRSLVDLGLLATNTLNLATGGLLKSTSTATTISGTGRLTAGGAAAGALAVTVDTVSTLTISSAIINNAGPNGTYGDGDDGVVALTKGGAGVLVLSGTNTYTGSNFLNSGTLRISAEANLGAGANDITFNGGTLSVTAGFTANAGKVFTVGAGLSGTLDIASGQTLTLGSTANDLTSLDSAGQLHKAGAGMLVIPGSNTAFTGTLQLDAGTLDLRAANALGGALRINAGSLALRADASTTFAGAVTLAADTTIDVARLTGTTAVGHSLGALSIGANTLTITGANASLTFGAVTLTGAATFSPTTANLTLGAVSGGFGLTKSGAGVLTLAGASTYTGVTNVTVGTLRVGVTDATSPNSAVISLASGAVLDLNGFSASVAALIGAGNVTLGSGALTAGADNSSGTFSGVISGAGSFTKTGSGALTLSGANTYTGATILSGGTITISAAERIANTSSVTVAYISTLNLNNFAETIGSLSGAGKVAAGSGALALGGDNSAANFSGILSGTGTLTKTGSGTQTLSGANTYTGATTISAGALNVQNAGALGGITAGTTVNAGGELQLQANVAVNAEPLTINGSGVSGSGALRNIADDNSFAGAVSLGTAATIGADAGSIALSNTVSKGTNLLTVTGAGTVSLEGAVSGTGTAGITKNGTGTLILSAANSYSGATLVNLGTLVILDAAALGTTGAGNGTIVASGAVMRIEDEIGLAISGELLTISGSGIGGTGALVSAQGDNSWSGAVTLAADSTVGVSDDTLTISGIISQTGGNRALTKAGVGSLTLTAANSFTGAINVSEGALIIGSTGSLASASIQVSSNAALSVASGGVISSSAALVADGEVDFNTATRTLGSLNGAAGGSVTLNGTVLSVGSGTFAGSIENGASAGGLTKTGAGTLLLTGANTFTGATTVTAGTLTAGASDALAATSSIAVNNSGTLLLAGTGDRINNAAGITLAGGTLNTGGLSETVGALTLSASSTIDFGNGASVLNFGLAGTTFAGGKTLTIINWSGSANGGGIDQLIFSQDLAGMLGQISFAGYGGVREISLGGGRFEIVAVPEPATWFGALGLLGFAGLRERRRLVRGFARFCK